MSFSTKKYTRPVLLAEIRKLSAADFISYKMFADALSPRAGSQSAKLTVLSNLVGQKKLRSLFGYNKSATAKRNLLNLVKNA